MQFLIDLYNAHPVLVSLSVYWVFSAAVSAMPTPMNGSLFYKWSYQFLHTLAGSVGRAVASKYPGFFNHSTTEEPKA